MNGNWMEFGMQPTKYIPLWRRVHAAVKRVAPQTAFVWSPNFSYGYPYGSQTGRMLAGPIPVDDLLLLDTNKDGKFDSNDDPYSPFYPGDEYVDWVGLSFYWKAVNAVPSYGMYALAANSGNFYNDYAVAKNKPMMVSEGGAVVYPHLVRPDSPSELAIKRAWWNQSITNLQFLDQFPLIKLFSIFEFRKVEDASPFGGIPPLSDFRITHEEQLIRAFREDFVRVADRFDLATYVSFEGDDRAQEEVSSEFLTWPGFECKKLSEWTHFENKCM
jgi:hypothetical protein